jgi:hypothetical protein
MADHPTATFEQFPPTAETDSLSRRLVLGVIAASIILRCWISLPTNFWEDEIVAATHSVQPFWQLWIDVVRNDVHPPLYFLQLHFWGLVSPLPDSVFDVWLILNSISWSVAAILSVNWTARRLYGTDACLLATLFFAISPVSVVMAGELRMYAMLSALIVWAHFLAVRTFDSDRTKLSTAVALTALLIAIVNTHAIGFLAVLSNGVFALHMLARPLRFRAVALWMGVYGLSALSAVPWIISGMLHDANLGDTTSTHAIISSVALTMLGRIGATQAVGGLGVALFSFVVIAGILLRQTRAMTLAYLVLPLVISTVVAIALKPIFKWNVFATIESPFMAYVLALTIFGHLKDRRLRLVAVALVAVALSVAALATRITASQGDDYRGLANIIRKNYQPGDYVYVPQTPMFWGMAWYLLGPHWGSTLAIAPPPSRQWQSIYARLGPRLVHELGLMPKSQLLNENGIEMLVGNDSIRQTRLASRVWLVTYPRADLAPGFPPAALNGLPARWTEIQSDTRLTLYANRTVASPRP